MRVTLTWGTRRWPNPRALDVALAVLLLMGAGYGADLLRDLPDRTVIARMGEVDQSTVVFDASDRPVFVLFKEHRLPVALGDVSSHFVDALLSIEDQRFYRHGAIDVRRILAATIADLFHGRAVQGASTLTQQLARASFLSPERTLRRKLQEILLAWRIERQYSKQDILQLYVNKVYFGDGLWGVEAAARGYFDKHASELTLAESALLAGLIKSPSTFAPTVDLEKATHRRNTVLQAMVDAGALDRPTWQRVRAEPVTLHRMLPREDTHGQYFKEEVRKSLVEHFGSERVLSGGLRVYSTVDPAMQAAAETVVGNALRDLDRRRGKTLKTLKTTSGGKRVDAEPLQAALIALDPLTGSVRALVGGRDFAASQFDRATQARRQPGSAFKPFVYAAALDAGYTPATLIGSLDEPIATSQGDWLPGDEHDDGSAMTVRNALRISSNHAAIQMLRQVGIARVVRSARDFGLVNQPAVPSLALGSGEVTLASLTAAYAAFADGGLVRKPVFIRRVEDSRGTLLFESLETASRATSPTTAFLMSAMLADVVNTGTASRSRQLGFTLPAAGKTGTTNDFHDAWFVGYTPTLVTGVWVGFDAPRTILRNGFAADVAVPLWTRFMSTAARGDTSAWFAPPPDVTTATICPVSGKRATSRCDQSRVEYFARGTEPAEDCDLHTAGPLRKLLALFGARGQ